MHTPFKEYEVIVVDNGTRLPLIERENLKDLLWYYTRPDGPQNILVLRNEKNEGYARANNQGMEKATGDYLVFLNNDVVVGPGWLEGMIKCYEGFPKTGIVGAYSNSVSGRQCVFEAKASRRAFFNRRIVTHCALVGRERLKEVGPWDETFPAGLYSDDDLSLRFIQAGYNNVIAPVFVLHFGSRTLMQNEEKYRANLEKAKELFQDKWGEKMFED